MTDFFLTFAVLAFFALLFALFAHWSRTTLPSETLYRCVGDGAQSALYLRRVRLSEFYGNCGPVNFPIDLRIEEFRRVTCAQDGAYTKATSDWFTRTWSEKAQGYVDSYVALERDEGRGLWQEQIKATQRVARDLRRSRSLLPACLGRWSANK